MNFQRKKNKEKKTEKILFLSFYELVSEGAIVSNSNPFFCLILFVFIEICAVLVWFASP